MNEPAVAVASTAPPSAIPQTQQGKSKARDFKRNNLVGYLFVSPWLIAFLLFTLIPMVISLGLAFTDYDLLSGGEFTGLENFQRMFFHTSSSFLL